MFSNGVHDGKTKTLVENFKTMKNEDIGKENQGKTCYSFPMSKSLIPDTHQRSKKKRRTCSSDFAIPIRILKTCTF